MNMHFQTKAPDTAKANRATSYIISRLLLPIMATILASCAAPSSSDDPVPAPLNTFSHNSYNFAPSMTASIPSDGQRVPVGSVLLNESEVRRQVASRLGIANDQEAIRQLANPANYTISYRINAASTSSANTFFSVARNAVNPLRADISVGDPVGAGLSFEGILRLVSSFQVEATINVRRPADPRGDAVIRSFVTVRVRERSADFDINNIITNSIETLSDNITFTPEAEVAENSRVAARASLSRGGNLLNEYALRLTSQASQVSLFWALRDIDNITNACGDGDIYIDNQDLRVKASRTYNYEVDPRPSYSCRLYVGEGGVNYLPVGVVVSAAANSTIRTRGDQILAGTQVASGSDVVSIKPSTNSSITCSSQGSSCYYADLDIEIANVDELPTIKFANSANTEFNGTNEGVGPIADYAAARLADATNVLSTATNFAPEANQLTITDRDWNDTTKVLRVVAEVEIARVVPSHGAAAFTVTRVGTTNNYRLVVDSTKLDYEAFSANELTDDKAIYQVFIRATDVDGADGGGSRSFTQSFGFEVKDVVYNPVLVDTITSATGILEGAAAFALDEDIISTVANGVTTISLLSGSQALRNNLHRVGSFAAIDPETGNDRNLEYDILANTDILNSNFALINNSPRGRQLIISGTGLTNGHSGNINLFVNHKNDLDAIAMIELPVVVNDIAYAALLQEREGQLATATPKFTSPIPIGEIAEGTAEATVTYIDGNSSLAGNYGLAAAGLRFGFAPASLLTAAGDLRNLGRRIDNSKFIIIDEGNGAIRVKEGEGANIKFNSPASYNLLVYVARQADYITIDNEARFLRNAALYDLAIIEVVVTDKNSAPIVRGPDRRIINTTQPLKVTIKENRAEKGTEVARITLTDDNGITREDFNLTNAMQTTPRLFNIEWRENRLSLTGVVTLNRDLDFESDGALLNSQNYTFSLADKGQYAYDPATGKTGPSIPAANVETLSMKIDFTLENVDEAPQLKLLTTSANVSESAPIGTEISDTAGRRDLFQITNVQELDEGNLTYAVEGPFAGILGVVTRDRVVNSTSLALNVTDADKLENLGDGRTFIATLRVTDEKSKLTTRINLPVMVVNDFSQDFAITNDHLSGLSINETAVATGNLLVDGFAIPATSLSRDYDDNFAANRRLQALSFNVIAGPQRTLDPVLPRFNAFEVFLSNDAYRLRLLDRDLIDQALFGNLDLSISIRRGQSAEDALASAARGMVRVNPAAATKGVIYANAADTALTPPVYSFTYNQTAYAPAVTRDASQRITAATDIDINLGRISGLATDSFVNIGDATYPTVNLRDDNNRNYRNFIRRSATRATLGSKNPANVASPTGQTVMINLAAPAAGTSVAERFDILKEDGRGNLVDASREFNNFFDLQVNGAQLQISQNVFNYTIENDEGEVTARGNYNSLDTIPLFAGSDTTQSITLNYFIRTYLEPRTPNNAANYALAQFSVAVRAAGTLAAEPVVNYAVENLNIFPVVDVAGNLVDGSIRFQWTNPTSFIGTSIDNLTLSVRNYTDADDTAVATTVLVETLSEDNTDNITKPGLQSIVRKLATDTYYQFSITPNFRVATENGVIANSSRTFIGTIAPITEPPVTPPGPDPEPTVPAQYLVEDFEATLSDDGTSISLSWENPSNFSDATSLDNLRLTIREYENATAENPIETTFMPLAGGNLTVGVRSLDLTNLDADRYYTFSLIPEFTSENEEGIASTATSTPERLYIPLPPPAQYLVERFNATLSDDGTSIELRWTNPANFTSTQFLSHLNLTIRGYENATAENTIAMRMRTIEVITSPSPNTQSLVLDVGDGADDLKAGRHYTFSIIPVFTSDNEEGIAVTATSDPARLEVRPVEYRLGDFIANLSDDRTSIGLSWTNPVSFSEVSGFLHLNISIFSYNSSTGAADSLIDTYRILDTDNPLTNSGPQTLDLANLNPGRHYSFSIVPVFGSDANAVGVAMTATSNPSRILLPTPYSVTNITAVIANMALEDANVTISWTNPDFNRTSIANLTLSIRGYYTLEGQRPVENATITRDITLVGANLTAGLGGNLTTGDRNYTITVPNNRYYEFSITPVATADDELGVTNTSDRILVGEQPTIRTYNVDNFNATLLIDNTTIQLSWTNPANFTNATSLENLRLTIFEYENANDENPIDTTFMPLADGNLTVGIQTLDVSGLPAGRHYAFSLIPVFGADNEEGIAVTATPVRLEIPIFEYRVEGFTATLIEDDTQIRLSWTNPANFSSANSLEHLNLTIRSYDAATGDAGLIENYRIYNTGNQFASFGPQSLVLSIEDVEINVNRHYSFSLVPVFGADNEVGITANAPSDSSRLKILPTIYRVANFNATLLSDDRTIQLNWTNPDDFATGIGLTALNLTISSYAEAGVGVAEETMMTLDGDYLNSGLQTLDLANLDIGRHYSFSIIPVFNLDNAVGAAATAPSDSSSIEIPPTEYRVANFNATLLSDDTTIQLNWTNPNEFAMDIGLTALTLTISSYTEASGGVADEAIMSLAGGNLTAGAQTLDLSDLPAGRYYAFSLIPLFNLDNATGVAVTATSTPVRLEIPPTEYRVELFTAALSDERTSISLSWTNPSNFGSAQFLTHLNLTISEYENATTENVMATMREIASTENSLVLGLDDVAINAGRHYTFSLIPVFSDPAEEGIAVTAPSGSSRILLPTPYSVTNITAVDTTANATQSMANVSVSWTNPAFNDTSIANLTLSISGFYTGDGQRPVEDADITRDITLIDGNLTAGDRNYTITVANNLYYEFSITPMFASVDGVGVTNTSDRLEVGTPPAPTEYRVTNFNATLINDDTAIQLNWTNPNFPEDTSVSSLQITISSYAEASGGVAGDTMMSLDGDYLNPVAQTLDLSNLDIGSYYAFSIIPVFGADNEVGIAVTATPARLLLPLTTESDSNGNGLIDITTAAEFDAIRGNLEGLGEDCSDGNVLVTCEGYELINDISLAEFAPWDPIGDATNSFSYRFEGNGNSISNISITSVDTDNVGLFANLNSTAEVRNLNLDNITISATGNKVGGLAGEVGGGANINDVHLTNVGISGNHSVGGLVGKMTLGYIMNASVQGGLVSASGDNAGGLFGWTSGGVIDRALAELQSVSAGGNNTGGLIGLHSEFTASLYINSTYAEADLLEGEGNVGGLLGGASASALGNEEPRRDTIIESSYANIGTIKARTSTSGGLLGANFDGSKEVEIKQSFSVVRQVNNSAPASAGGLFGFGGQGVLIPSLSEPSLETEFSYWDNSTIFTEGDPFAEGLADIEERREGNQTSTALQSGTTDTIYTGWNDPRWDFGGDTDYPVLKDLIRSVEEQRDALRRRLSP